MAGGIHLAALGISTDILELYELQRDCRTQGREGPKTTFGKRAKSLFQSIKLIGELYEHPRTGTGKPEPLSGDRLGQWSRRISKRHRLVYEIQDTDVIVLVLTAYGHYGDK